MRSITASDRLLLVKLASTLPVGSEERRAILAAVSSSSEISKRARKEESSGKARRPITVGGVKYTEFKYEISPRSIYVELFNDEGDSIFAEKKEDLSEDEFFDAALSDVDESLRGGNLPDGFREGDF